MRWLNILYAYALAMYILALYVVLPNLILPNHSPGSQWWLVVRAERFDAASVRSVCVLSGLCAASYCVRYITEAYTSRTLALAVQILKGGSVCQACVYHRSFCIRRLGMAGVL